MSLNHVRPWRNIYRRESRQIMVGSVPVGGDAPISVQTMTNTLTTDVKATIAQVARDRIDPPVACGRLECRWPTRPAAGHVADDCDELAVAAQTAIGKTPEAGWMVPGRGDRRHRDPGHRPFHRDLILCVGQHAYFFRRSNFVRRWMIQAKGKSIDAMVTERLLCIPMV